MQEYNIDRTMKKSCTKLDVKVESIFINISLFAVIAYKLLINLLMINIFILLIFLCVFLVN